MQSVFLVRSFLTFAPRFMYRHPTKLGQFLELSRRYSGGFLEFGRFLRMLIYDIVMYMLVLLMQPRIVVETGVEHGVSSWIVLLAMERNGKGALHSIDLPNQDVVDESIGFRQRNIMPPGKETG